jgi:hypothetical protein
MGEVCRHVSLKVMEVMEFSVNTILFGVICCCSQSDKAGDAFQPAIKAVAARVTGSAGVPNSVCL